MNLFFTRHSSTFSPDEKPLPDTYYLVPTPQYLITAFPDTDYNGDTFSDQQLMELIMQIEIVKTKRDLHKFIQFPYRLYQNDPV